MNGGPTCTRAWQAEAIEDGRLQGPERDAFVRHAAQCGDCTRELAALSRLRELGAALETRESTDLERRRLRQNILRRADDAMVGGERRFGGVARWASAVAVIACVASVALWMTRKNESPAVTPPALIAREAPRFDIVVSEGGAYRVERSEPHLFVGVEPGSYSVHVHELTSAQRFVMRLPDGELEVHGTRFVVAVGPTGTRSVAVSEGLVALRIRGSHELLLHAGDAWSAPVPPPVAASASAVASAEPAEKRLAPATSSSTVSTPKADAGSAFTRAMAAYSRGDFAESERLFLAFEREFPSDARTEDSAFLRVTARSRRGDAAGAKALAKEYLRRFPAGLRRVEAERLSR